jgi:hypothetical protein
MLSLKTSVPIYYTIERKTKKSSTHLVGDNWVRNLHFQLKNKVKQHYHALIAASLPSVDTPILQFTLSIEIFYKTHTCDPSNIAHQMEKYTLDAFKSLGYIIDDNCLYHMGTIVYPPIKDPINPRCEITLSPFKQEV